MCSAECLGCFLSLEFMIITIDDDDGEVVQGTCCAMWLQMMSLTGWMEWIAVYIGWMCGIGHIAMYDQVVRVELEEQGLGRYQSSARADVLQQTGH